MYKIMEMQMHQISSLCNYALNRKHQINIDCMLNDGICFLFVGQSINRRNIRLFFLYSIFSLKPFTFQFAFPNKLTFDVWPMYGHDKYNRIKFER